MAIAQASQLIHVLVIPFPLPGHMLPLLDLAHLLSARFHLKVTIAITPEHLPTLLSRCPTAAPLLLPFPNDPNLAIRNTGDAVAVARNVRQTMRALAVLREPLLRWACSGADEPPTIILADFFHGWSHCLAVDLSVPALVFSTTGAGSTAIINSLWRRIPKRSNPDDPDELVSFPNLPRSPLFPWRHLSAIYRSYEAGDPLSEFVRASFEANLGAAGFIFNTFAELEKPHLDHIRHDLGHTRVWSIGPLALPAIGHRECTSSAMQEEVQSWIDGCAARSVVYVAFGSLAVLSEEQAATLAAGLERSQARFVWATRDAVPLPEGFEARVAGRGLVVRGWAPQAAILRHQAVGAFVTHCGWNSILEAAAAGVALLTWPLSADQFTNARMMEGEAGMGICLCEGGDAVPDPDELARIIAESVGKAGSARREKARELATKAAAAVEVGGSSYVDMAAMVEEMSKLTAANKIPNGSNGEAMDKKCSKIE